MPRPESCFPEAHYVAASNKVVIILVLTAADSAEVVRWTSCSSCSEGSVHDGTMCKRNFLQVLSARRAASDGAMHGRRGC